LATVVHNSQLEQFQQFEKKYNKIYQNEQERQFRMQIFETNLVRINLLNRRQGANSTVFGVTKFADLTPDEFYSKYLIKDLEQKREKNRASNKKLHLEIPEGFSIPNSFDWRNKKGIVSPVKDQGMCGSCWAFSATEAIESQWALAGHTLTSLSPQQIVDCDKGRGDLGCEGGDTPTAYEYVIAAGGLDTEKSYPYAGTDQDCKVNNNTRVAKISNWGYITQNQNETEMQAALVLRGPLSICVDATTWQFYFGGVVSWYCARDLDHCVVITGFQDYTTWDDVVMPIWMIRNSWGSDWGEEGYIYVERGYDLCGVADEVTLPIV